MPPNYEDRDTTVVVEVIKDLTERLEKYEAANTEGRAAFQSTIEASIVTVRKDFNRALQPIQLEVLNLRDLHETDNKDRGARQAQVDISFAEIRLIIRQLVYVVVGMLLGLLVELALIIYLVVRLNSVIIAR